VSEGGFREQLRAPAGILFFNYLLILEMEMSKSPKYTHKLTPKGRTGATGAEPVLGSVV
jgi:hypothetical protein